MRMFVSAIALAAAWVVAPVAAHADPGFVASRTFARAGPDESFPRVALLPRGTRIEVRGCLDRYDWCDVQWGWRRYQRGWISEDVIDFYYRGRPWRAFDYFRFRRPAIIFFELDRYWNENYRGQRFFRERDQFRRFDRRGGQNDQGDRDRRGDHNRSDQYQNGSGQGSDHGPDHGIDNQSGHDHRGGVGGPPPGPQTGQPGYDQHDRDARYRRGGRDDTNDGALGSHSSTQNGTPPVNTQTPQGQGGSPPNHDQHGGQITGGQTTGGQTGGQTTGGQTGGQTNGGQNTGGQNTGGQNNDQSHDQGQGHDRNAHHGRHNDQNGDQNCSVNQNNERVCTHPPNHS